MRDDIFENNNENNNVNNNVNNMGGENQDYGFTLVETPVAEETDTNEISTSSSEYNYWETKASEQTQDATYQSASYGYDASENQNYTKQNTEPENKKHKKKGGFGKTLAKTAAIAAVFGLVSGGVFQGVNVAVNGTNNSQPVIIESTKSSAPVSATNTSSTKTNNASVAELVENTMPSIVSITSTIKENINYFGKNLSQEAEGSGSGIIVGKNDDQLLIVTNNHVIDGATTISVCFIDNEIVEAEVKGTDSSSDLAVVAVNTKDIKSSTLEKIKVATLGNSDDVKVGEMAVAIGNALGYGQSVTVGYIGAKDRQVATESKGSSSASTMKLLQTDAAINPGNSGGALLNLNGEVIGINSVKYASTDVEGMGYAIPISSAIPIINDLMNREVLKETEKGYLGISGADITEDNNIYNMPTGVYVAEVAEGSAAAEGGMKVGDIIVKINNTQVTSINSVQEKVNNTKVGTKITVIVKRSDNGEYKEVKLNITLKGSDSLNSLDNGSSPNSNGQSGSSNGENGQQTPQDNQNGQGNDADDIFRNFIDNFGN